MVKSKIIAWALFPLYYLWGKTLRIERSGYHQVEKFRNNRPVIFTLWHDELFSPCFLHRREGIIAVVSASKDGEILAQILSGLGYNLVRGSSHKQGVRALRDACKKIQELRKDVVFTVDGPKGPRHEVKEGAIYLAYKAEAPIVPVRVKLSRVKYLEKAWDKFQIPLPGSRSKVIYGRPYSIEAKKLNSEIILQEKNRLQKKLNNLRIRPDDV